MVRMVFQNVRGILVITILLVSGAGSGRALNSVQQKRCPEPTKSPFRYAITHNDEVDYVVNGVTRKYRSVDVLLGLESFSEATLRHLFERLSKRYPKVDWLYVHVHTNLADVYTPEEAEQIAPSARCEYLRSDKYPSATYTRKDDFEGFNYSTNEPGSSVKTIRLRG